MTRAEVVVDLLDTYGRTYSDQAGFILRDKPTPLFKLLVLTTVLSARIDANVAVRAATNLFADGLRTPEKMRDSTWDQRIDPLVRARYGRYDQSTATALAESAEFLFEWYQGDLRLLRAAAGGDVEWMSGLLREFPRIGPVGADIFCREVQHVWPEVGPFFDQRALGAASTLGLPTTPARLASLVAQEDLARFANALVRWSLDHPVALS